MGTSGTLINMVTRSGTNRFGGQTLGDVSGQGDAVGQHRRAPEGVGLPAGGAGRRIHLQLQHPGAAGRSFRTSCSTSASIERSADAVNVPGYPAVSPPQIPPLLSGNTQDTTDITSITGKVTYALERPQPVRGVQQLSVVPKAQPRRERQQHARFEHRRGRHLRHLAGGLDDDVAAGRSFGDTKLNYNNTHFPLAQKTDLQTILDNPPACVIATRRPRR